MLAYLRQQWPHHRWAIEGAQGFGGPSAQRLLADGTAVVDVPGKLSARVRVFDTRNAGRFNRRPPSTDSGNGPRAAADTPHADERPGAVRGAAPDASYQVHPIGWIESPLLDTAEAPNQGELGAPYTWLVLNPTVREGARDLAVGSDITVLTWAHQARRNMLVTHPAAIRPGPSGACSAPDHLPAPTLSASTE